MRRPSEHFRHKTPTSYILYISLRASTRKIRSLSQ
nr:MAG TPA: hypothetical protein [Caudoviricetes sp.]